MDVIVPHLVVKELKGFYIILYLDDGWIRGASKHECRLVRYELQHRDLLW